MSSPMHRCVFLAWGLIVCLSATSHRLAAEQLQWKLQAGDQFKVTLEQTTQRKTEVKGKILQFDEQMLMEMDWKVSKVDDNKIATIQQRLTRFKFLLQPSDGSTIEYDSAAEVSPTGVASELADSIQALMKGDVTIQLDPHGKIVDAKISKEAMDAMRDVPGTMRLRKLLGPQGLRDTLGQSIAVLPERAIQPGDQWTQQQTSQLEMGTVHQTQTFTLRDWDEHQGRRRAKIGVVSELKLDPKEDAVRKPQKITSYFNEGTLFFDPEQGQFTESEVVLRMTTETPYRDMTIAVEGSSTLKAKFERVAAQASGDQGS